MSRSLPPLPPRSAPASLARHASTVAGLTLLSRVLGFARDAAVAALFGTGVVADASVAGLAIPQLARRLLGEGALNAAILPRLAGGESLLADASAPRRAAALLLVFTGAAALVALLLAVFMPQVTLALAPGFRDDPARMEGAVFAGRLALVCLPLATLAGVIAALANAAGRVTRPAFAPAAGNVAVLAVIGALAVAGAAQGSTALALLALAAVAGALAQLAVIGAACPWRVAELRPDRAAIRAAWPMLLAAGPTLLAACLPQVRILVANAAASGTDGGVAALFYATRLVELPLGLIGASAGAVLLPALSRGASSATAGRDGLAAALALTAPAAAGLFLLAEPIVRVLFQRGAFDAAAAALTVEALRLLALSLPLQALERILATIGFASGFGRLVTRASLAGLVVGGLAGFALATPLGLAGPALGVVISSAVALAGLGLALARAGLMRPGGAELRRLAAILLATALMALPVSAGARLLAAPLAAGGLAGAAALAGVVLAGVASYGAGATLFGVLPRRRRG